jgi:hypothetical protein
MEAHRCHHSTGDQVSVAIPKLRVSLLQSLDAHPVNQTQLLRNPRKVMLGLSLILDTVSRKSGVGLKAATPA